MSHRPDPLLFLHAPIGFRYGNGIVSTDLNGNDDVGRASILQTDHRLIVAGRAFNGTNSDFALTRFWPDGSLDLGFGTNGTTITSFAGDSIIHAITLDAQERIVIAGRQFNSNWDFAVSRYLTDGSPDVSFGTNGHATVDFSGDDFARAVGIDSQNRVVVVGYTNLGVLGDFDFAVARLLSDGTLDPAFNATGRQAVNFPGDDWDTAHALLIDGSDQIIAAGRTINGGNTEFALARFTTAGSLDPTFSGDGIHSQAFGTDAVAWAMTFDETDRIVLAGRSWNGSQYDVRLARYTAAGANNGAVAIGNDLGAIARGIVLDEQNRFVVSGRSYDGVQWNPMTQRVQNTGALDTSFNTTGISVQTLAREGYLLTSSYSPGLLYSVGHFDNGIDLDLLVLRQGITGALALSGAPDVYLDSDGLVTTAIGTADDISYGVRTQPDSKIISVGYTNNAGTKEIALTRLLIDGSLDTSFSGDGIVTTNVGGLDAVGTAITLHPDGRIVTGGYVNSGDGFDFVITRYNTDGALDVSFSGDGIEQTSVSPTDDVANAIAIDNLNRPILAGYAQSGARKDLALVRYTTDGVLDSTFGGDGIVKELFVTGGQDSTASSVQVLPDNRIVVGGHAGSGSNMQFGLARFQSDGSLDPTFGTGGLVTTNVDTNGGAQLLDLALQADNRIIAVGRTMGRSQNFVVVRYSTDGSLDASFDGDGILVSSITSQNDIAYGVEITANNKIIVVGHGNNEYDLVVARYLSNGAFDTSFSNDGIFVTDLNGADDFGFDVTQDAAGRIVVSGGTFNGTNWDFAVLRLFP